MIISVLKRLGFEFSEAVLTTIEFPQKFCNQLGMNGTHDLGTLLKTLCPTLVPGEFVFVTRALGKYGDGIELRPIASFAESEGLTLVVPKELADIAGEHYQSVFRMLTLQVHSKLDAVGLTASISTALYKRGISANVVAAFFHDHVFVPSERAQEALEVLEQLMNTKDT